MVSRTLWYPQDKLELENMLEKFLKYKPKKNIHGLMVPHAGYIFSGKIAGKAYSLLKQCPKNKAVVVGPSHFKAFAGVASISKIKTPLGIIKISKNKFEKLEYEHSVLNQIPFLQKLGFKEVLPLVIGQLNEDNIKELSEFLNEKKQEFIFIFSSDLSHFLEYNQAIKEDRHTISIIKNLEIDKWREINACGVFSIMIMMHLCKINKWKPKLIEYKNSGDITGDKTSVVGYSSFYF